MKHKTKKAITVGSSQTRKLGEKLAREIIRENSWLNSCRFARILALNGDLGSGKTTFLQGFAKGLGIKEKILSPTFVILKHFKITNQNSKITEFTDFYHIDCYRIEKPKELLNLGFKEIIQNPQNIVAIEWAEKVEKILPKNYLKLQFQFIGKNKRKILIP